MTGWLNVYFYLLFLLNTSIEPYQWCQDLTEARHVLYKNQAHVLYFNFSCVYNCDLHPEILNSWQENVETTVPALHVCLMCGTHESAIGLTDGHRQWELGKLWSWTCLTPFPVVNAHSGSYDYLSDFTQLYFFRHRNICRFHTARRQII